MSQFTEFINQKSPLKPHELTASILNFESTLTGITPFTNESNEDPNNTIQLQNLCENLIMKEPRFSVARARTFFDRYCFFSWTRQTQTITYTQKLLPPWTRHTHTHRCYYLRGLGKHTHIYTHRCFYLRGLGTNTHTQMLLPPWTRKSCARERTHTRTHAHTDNTYRHQC